MFLIVAAAVFCSSSLASGFTVTNCGGSLSTLHQVVIGGCNQTADTCVLRKGTNVSLAIDFTINEPASVLNAYAYAVVVGIPLPLSMPSPYPCNDPNSGVTCPIATGTYLFYKTKAQIPQDAPTASGQFLFKLKDQSGNTVVCIQFPFQTQ